MKKWILAIVLCLVMCLTACFALADGTSGTNMVLPNEDEVTVTARYITGDTRVVPMDSSVTVNTPVGQNISQIQLTIKDTSTWKTVARVTNDTAGAPNGKLGMSFNAVGIGQGEFKPGFQTGHLYLAELMAIPAGAENDSTQWEGFWSGILTVVTADNANSSTGGLQLYLNTTEPEIGCASVFITAFDPNAKNVWIELDGEAIQGENDQKSMSFYARFDEPGSHTVRAVSMDADGNRKTSDTQTFAMVRKETNYQLYPGVTTPVTYTIGSTTKGLELLPGTITAGTDISYTIQRVTQTLGTDAAGLQHQVRYDSWLDDLTDEEGSIELPCYRRRPESDVANGPLLPDNDADGYRTITIDGDELQVGHMYRLYVEITSSGCTPVVYSKTFMVLPSQMDTQHSITLSFRGETEDSTDPLNIQQFKQFRLHASAPDATVVRFWNGEEFEYLNNWIGGGWTGGFDFDWKTWGKGEHKYFIQAYYGELSETPWDEMNWDPACISNILTLNAIQDVPSAKVVPTYTITLPSGDTLPQGGSFTVTQGEYYTVTLGNTDQEISREDVYFGANLYNGDGIDAYYEPKGKIFTIPTADLEPGYYTLAIYTETNGAGYAQIPSYFRVDAPTNPPANGFMITTTAPKVNDVYTVESYEDFGITLYAPEKEGYDRYYQFFDGQNWWDAWDDSSVTFESELDPGTWEVYAKVIYVPKDEGQNDIEYESAHLSFKATSLGVSGVTLNAPGSYTVTQNGGDYTATISVPDGFNRNLYANEYWELRLKDDEGEDLEERNWNQDGPIQDSISFDCSRFKAGKTYQLQFHLNVQGYDPIDEDVCFAAVSPAEEQVGTFVTLTVTDKETGTVNPASILSNKEVTVKVTKSDDITAVRVLNGNHWEIWCGDDKYQCDWAYGSGIVGFIAQGTTDEAVWNVPGFDWDNFNWNSVDWDVTSNLVTVRFTAPNGKIGKPTLSLAPNQKTYTRGDIITVTVGKVAGADIYELKIIPLNANGDEDWSRSTQMQMDMDGSGEGSFTFTIRTDHMEPGIYRIWVENIGKGYDRNASDRTEIEIKAGTEVPAAVLEFLGATIDSETGKASINTNTNIELYAFVPEARDIWLEIEKEDNEGWRNDRNNGEDYAFWEFGEAFKGTYIFKLYGRVNEHDEDTPFVTKTLQVKADNGSLKEAMISLSDNVIPLGATGTLSGSFKTDKNAKWYESRLVYRGPDGSWDDDEIQSIRFDKQAFTDDGSKDFELDYSCFEKIGIYEIQVTGGATGYNGTDVRKQIAVTSTASQNLTLTVNGSAEANQNILSSENFTVKVTYGNNTEQPTAVRVLNGNNWDFWHGENENFERDWSVGDGERLFYAEATWTPNINFEDKNWDEKVAWTGRSNAIVLTIDNPYGEMVAPTFTIGNVADDQGNIVIPWGEDLIINIADEGPYVIDQTDQGGKTIVKDGWFNLNLEVERCNENGKWWDRVDGNYHVLSGVNHIMTYNLEDGCRYRVEVGADGWGYNGKSTKLEFTLAKRSDQGVNKVFTVNGGTGNITVSSGTELVLSAYHPGTDQCRIVITEEGNYDWQDEKNDCQNGLLMDKWRADHAGVYTLTAYGCMDDDDLIGTIQVTATAESGNLGALQATITDASNNPTEKAYVGAPLTINYTAVTGGENLDPDDVEYSYWIHSDDDNSNLLNGRRHGAGTLIIDTRRLESGVYWIELDAVTAGYNQSHKTLYFALLDRDDTYKSGENYFFTISATEIPTEKGAHMIGYMPGADEIQLLYYRNNDTEWESMDDRKGPGISTWIGDGQAATFRICISGRFGQEWTDPVQVCTVTFTAIDDLAAPVITINGTTLSDTNHVVTAYAQNPGTMHVIINKVPNASNYRVQVSQHGDGWPIYSKNFETTQTEDDTIEFDITDERIEAGCLYKIECDARAVGYNFSQYEDSFLLQDGETTGGVTLSVSPDTTDGQFWTGENVKVHVVAKDATGFRVYKGGEVRTYTGNECDFGWNVDDEDTYFYAYATNDPIPEGNFDWNTLTWNRRSELVYVKANTLGSIPDSEMPVLMFNNQVTKGEWFEFSINGGTARQMDIRISDDQGNEREFRQFWTPGVYRIPTANLDPGQYWVNLCCVKDGYLWTKTQNMVLYVNAPAQGQDKAFFMVDKVTSDEGVVTLYLNEPFIPSVYAPGAEHIWIGNTHDGEIWGDWDGDNGTNHPGWEWWYDELREGGWGLTAWARYPGSDERVVIGNLIFNVQEPAQLAKTEIQVDDVIDSTDIFYVDIPVVDYGVFYTLQIRSSTDGNGTDLFKQTRTAVEVNEEGRITFTIPANTLAPNDTYWIDCYAEPARYDYAHMGSGSRKEIIVTGTSDQNLTVSVNGDTSATTQILSSQSFKVKLTYSSANRPTAIRIRNGNQWEYWTESEDKFERDWNFGDGEQLIYAEATWTESIDFDNDNWDEQVAWTGRSNIIHLTITSPFGEMIAPVFTIGNPEMGAQGSGIIPWGDDLIINIADEGPCVIDAEDEGGKSVVKGGWFFLNIEVKRGEGNEAWWDRINQNYSYSVNSGVNRIPTYQLNEGHYRVEIGADGEGYSGRSSRIEFSIGKRNEGENGTRAFQVTGGTATTVEGIVTVTAPTHTQLQLYAYQTGAEWYCVNITKDGDDNWSNKKDNCQGGMLIDNWRPDSAGSYTLTAYAYGHLRDQAGNIIQDASGNDEWENLIGTIRVEATASNGKLSKPEATMADKAYVGNTIEITFSPVTAVNPPAETSLNDADVEYSYWIHSSYDNNNIDHDNRHGAGKLTISTDGMEPGVYWVELDAMATGYDQGHNTLYFALIDEEAFDLSTNDYVFSISKKSFVTETNAEIVAYIPGVEEINVLVRKVYADENHEDMKEIERRNGPGLKTWFNRGDSGTFDIYISGKVDGRWRYPIKVATVTVTAEHTFDADPTIMVNGSTSGNVVPADLTNDQQMNVSIARDAKAEGYHVQIRKYGDGRTFFDQFIDLNNSGKDGRIAISDSSVEITLQDSNIEPGEFYEINCWVHATGYECREGYRYFLLEKGQISENVILTVEPTADDGFWTAENARMQAMATGATAIKIQVNGQERYYRDNEVEDDWYINSVDSLFVAYATTGEIPEGDFDWNELNVNWTMRSQIIRVHAQTNGNLPEYDMPDIRFNNQVTKGDWFEFNIFGGDAKQIDIRIWDEDGQEVEFRQLWAPGTYRIPTANLNAGQKYWVNISCVKERYMWTNGQAMELYVNAPATGNDAFFRVDKTTMSGATILYPHENFIPTVYAPGADHVWIGDSSWDLDPDNREGIWGDWNGESGTNKPGWEWWFDDPGTYTLIAWQRQTGSTDITEIGRITFTVVEPEAPEIQMASPYVISGIESATVYVHLKGHANGACANLRPINKDGSAGDFIYREWARMRMLEEPEDGYEGYISLSTDGLADGTYQIIVESFSGNAGYIGVMQTVRILEYPYEAEPSLQMPNGLTEIEEEAFAGISTRVLILNSGVTKIGKRAFAGSNIQYVVFPRNAENITIAEDAFEGSNVEVIFGFYDFAKDLAETLHTFYYNMWRITGDG